MAFCAFDAIRWNFLDNQFHELFFFFLYLIGDADFLYSVEVS